MYDKSREYSEVRWDMPDGIWPVRPLKDKSSTVSPVSALIEGGIVPLMEFESRYSVCSATSEPIDAGMLLVKALTYARKVINDVIPPILDGIVPLILLFPTSR